MTDRIYVIAQAPLFKDGSLNEDRVQTRMLGYSTYEAGIIGLCTIVDIDRKALMENDDGSAVIQTNGFQFMLFKNEANPIKTH